MSEEKVVYKYFADYIFKETGIIYIEKDYYRLENRVMNLSKKYGVDGASGIHQLYLLNTTEEMHQDLVDIATNNETFFFRDIKPYKALVKGVVPDILEKKVIKTINIWSAACSTGQEPYSILMMLLEIPQCGSFNIDATDISNKALKKAISGHYDHLEVQRGLPAQKLIKYFAQGPDDSWEVKLDFRNKINFSKFNLLDGVYKRDHYDVIFCRNVLIYQDTENRNMIMSKIRDCLRPGGYLFLGNGESIIGCKVPFTQKKIDDYMVFQREE